MKEGKNGWNLKTKGYMTSEPSYQKITPKEACDAIKFEHVIMFVKIEDGSETESRAYVPKEHIKELQNEWESERDYANQMEAIADRLRAENAKIRELLTDAYKDMDAWQMVIANSDQWGYGKGCLERLCKMREAMCELGIEVD